MNEDSSAPDNYVNPVGMPPIPGTGQPTPWPEFISRPVMPDDLLGRTTRQHPLTTDECIPKKGKARQIQINQADHGYIVNVGCQTLVFESMDTLIEKLTAYLKDPNATETKWMAEGIL